MTDSVETLVIGAGPAGLAVAACLRRRAVPFALIERADQIASSWRRHYDRLHLHTDRRNSALPYLGFPAGTPRYPSRTQVIAYLEAYARRFELSAHCGEEARSIRPCPRGWQTSTSSRVLESRQVVVASGYNALPLLPHWPGQERFAGRILHSSDYRNGSAFRGQRVLVVGFGNSGGEIAIDLHECGARVAMAVRSAVNIIPRELLGLPIVSIGAALSRLPVRLADALAAPLLRLTVGDITKLGFRKLPMGPISQIKIQARIPLIDIGTLALIRRGDIQVLGGLRELSAAGVTSDDGVTRSFDAIIAATGYRSGIDRLFGTTSGGALPAQGGLYFCGFRVTPNGMLREIGREALRIADDIARSAKPRSRLHGVRP